MTNGGGLAAADKGAKKNDKGAKKGGAAQPCKLAKIVVTVVRKDGAKGDNFFSDIYLEGQAGKVTWRNPHAEFELELATDLKLPTDLATRALPLPPAPGRSRPRGGRGGRRR